MMEMEEARNYLFGLHRFGCETGAVRAKRALERLGNPQDNLNVIHVAGTNGKGSVCAYMSNALMAQGYRIGLFTSPHLVKVNERIRINGVMISDEDFLKYYQRVRAVSEEIQSEGKDGLAFFDFMFVMAVLYFVGHDTDYVVMETGLGGRTDATAALSTKMLSVITSLSLDHTEILGDTIEQIAAEKAGIITEGVPLVAWKSSEETYRILEDNAIKCGSDAYFVDENSYKIHKIETKQVDFSLDNQYYRNSVFSIQNTGLYQVMNAALALEALTKLPGADGFDVDQIVESVKKTHWEGRMEEVENNIYLDGAHNPDGIARFIETAGFMKGNHRNYLLFGAVREKDYDNMIKQIAGSDCFDGYILTQINNRRGLPVSNMQESFAKYTDKPVYVQEDNAKAFEFAKALLSGDDILFCAGSLYLVGALKELMGEEL